MGIAAPVIWRAGPQGQVGDQLGDLLGGGQAPVGSSAAATSSIGVSVSPGQTASMLMFWPARSSVMARVNWTTAPLDAQEATTTAARAASNGPMQA